MILSNNISESHRLTKVAKLGNTKEGDQLKALPNFEMIRRRIR